MATTLLISPTIICDDDVFIEDSGLPSGDNLRKLPTSPALHQVVVPYGLLISVGKFLANEVSRKHYLHFMNVLVQYCTDHNYIILARKRRRTFNGS